MTWQSVTWHCIETFPHTRFTVYEGHRRICDCESEADAVKIVNLHNTMVKIVNYDLPIGKSYYEAAEEALKIEK